MPKRYGDLNLKDLREKAGLDFAHYTFKRGQCSCCYSPKDLPKRYWKDNTIREDNDYTYILFKNADNGSGHVTKKDHIKDKTYILWNFPIEKMELVCSLLQEQLGDEYIVIAPKDKWTCIEVREVQKINE